MDTHERMKPAINWQALFLWGGYAAAIVVLILDLKVWRP